MGETTDKILDTAKGYNKKVETWMDTGSDTVKGLKLAGMAGICALVFGSIVYGATQDERQHVENTLNTLDTQSFVVFDSQQDCTSKGYDASLCLESQENAIDLSTHFQEPVQYTNLNECVSKFGNCPDKRPLTTRYNIDMYQYKPVLGPWQAASDDITTSAQLYKTAEANTYLRIDGQNISL